MSTSSIKAGEAFYEITLSDKTKEGLDKARQRLQSFAATVGAIGASLSAAAGAGLSGFVAAASQFAEFGSSINDFAARTGVSSEWAQSFKAGAELAGSSLGAVEKAIRKMQKTLVKEGKLNGMMPEEQFIAIAEEISKIEDPTKRAAAAMKYFGGAGASILPMLDGGAQALRENLERMQNMGLILSDEDVILADELGDAWDTLKMTMMATVRVIGASVAPTLLIIINTVTDLTSWVAKAAQSNKGLFQAIAVGLSILGGFGAALTALGGAGLVLAGIMAAVPAIVTGVATTMGMLSAVFAAAVSPVGLIVIAVAALVALLPVLAYVLDQAITGGAGLKFLSDAFAELYNIASSAIGGIFDAIANGNWSLAAAIAGAALNTAFVTAWGWIKMGFSDFGTWLLNYLTDLFGSQVVGIVLKGMKAIIDTINSAAATFGIDTGLDSKGLDKLIKSSGDSGEFKKELDARNKAYRASVQKDIDAAKGEQKLLEDIAAEGRKKKAEGPQTGNLRLGDLSTGTAITENKAIQSLGAISAASAGRIGQNIPQFDDMKKIAEDSKDLLAKIEENTADGGDEFGD